MTTITVKINLKSIAKTCATVILAGAAGYGLATLMGGNGSPGSTGGAGAPTAAIAAGTTGTQQANPMSGAGNSWAGLAPLSDTWVKQALGASLKNASGANVKLPTRPILLTAYWCPYCHQTLETLSQYHLLSKVQVVGLGFDGTDGGQAALNVSSVPQAVQVYQKAMKQIGVSIQPSSILYAMPGTGLDTQVTSYPEMLVPHGGKWYYLSGYSSNPATYKNIIFMSWEKDQHDLVR